jgi:hypothetical protein
MSFWLKITKSLGDGILNAIAWLSRDSTGLPDANFKASVERLGIVKQALFNFR